MLRRLLSYLLFDNNRNITALLNNVAVIAQPSLREVCRQRGSESLTLCGNPRPNQALKRQLIDQSKRATTAIRKSLHYAVFTPINDLVTRDPRNPKLPAQPGNLLLV